ncbi:MAG: permease [Pleomorphochaeta sp.]
MKLIKKYKLFLFTLLILVIVYFINEDIGIKAFNKTKNSVIYMAQYIPVIFILMGLLDVWVPKKAMANLMGEGSGIKGILLSIFCGTCAAGPLYGAFPIVGVFMKKGVKFSNILIFLGTWSCAKISIILFEVASLGPKFTFTRLTIDLVGIIVISNAIAKIVPKKELEKLYENVEGN